MSDDLQLKSSTGNTTAANQQPTPPKKKGGKGCLGGCLIGCLVIGLILAIVIIAPTVYVSSLEDHEKGAVLVWVAKTDGFSEGFKEGIRESDQLNDSQKEILVTMYDSFMTKYDQLPTQDQKKANGYIWVLAKALFTDNEGFADNPPEEFPLFLEMFISPQQIQEFTGQSSSTPTTTTTTQQDDQANVQENQANTTTTTPTTTTNSDPTTTTPQTSGQTTSTPNAEEYDF